MREYKVGDRVLSQGVKCFVIGVRFSVVSNHKILRLATETGIPWQDKSDYVKPILKVKNGVICE